MLNQLEPEKKAVLMGEPPKVKDENNNRPQISDSLHENSTKVNPIKWGIPLPFFSTNTPKFPADCLPEALKNYVIAVSEATQTPIDMAAVASLAVISACVQGKFKVMGKPDWTEPLNLYSVIVANPAERKSAVLELLTNPISEYERKENDRLKPDIEKSKIEKKALTKEIEKLINKGTDKQELFARQDEMTNFKEIKPLRLIADDVSPEALTSLLADNGGRMSVISSEGGVFEILQGRYSQNVNIDTFLKAHCGDVIHVDRKGRESEYIQAPCLTVLLSVQPQVLDGLINNDVFRGRGLTARFLYSIPKSTVGNRKFETPEIPQELKVNYKDLCFDLLGINHENIVILKLSNEAYKESANFANSLEPRLIDDLENISDFAGKLHGAILRIAGNLHIAKYLVFAGDYEISKETMCAAINIGNYFLAHAQVAYRLMGTDEQTQAARYILKRLEKEQPASATKTELLRLCRRFKKVDELTSPISLLIEYGYLKEEQPQYNGTGRPPELIYHVNLTFDRLHPKNHKKCKKAHFSNSRNPENSRFLSFESPEFSNVVT
jgi:hypothetical protein